MKKIVPLLFVVLCLTLCLIPSLGMIAAPTADTVGNERQTTLPSLTNEDGSFNLGYFTGLGDYFAKHFAFRKEAITADAKIQSDIFATSNIDTVTVGTDGWLYYASTLDDYLGKNAMSSREVSDLVHNLGIIRDYARQKGAEFLFTSPPNKNTLYPEHMPYYTGAKAGDVYNRDLVSAALAQSDIRYVNLFELFEDQDEVLYFERDSHWNNKGALLASDAILTELGKAHDDYSTAEVSRRKDFAGDLSAMIYPAGDEKEYNYYYGAEDRYTTEAKSVEDAHIDTVNKDAGGTLYMYRDSFGNALVPFFSAAYGEAHFTKAFPMDLAKDLETYHPDVFVMELVERNLRWLITQPPILPSPQLSYVRTAEEELDGHIAAEAGLSFYSRDYVKFSGTLDADIAEDEDVILAAVTDAAGAEAIYECYGLAAEDGRIGFTAYARADKVDLSGELKISVIIQRGTDFIRVGSTTATIGGNEQ
jgi:hypothetical protein